MKRIITKDYWRKFGLTPIDVLGVLVKKIYNSITVYWFIKKEIYGQNDLVVCIYKLIVLTIHL
jgi:hypothetical protein